MKGIKGMLAGVTVAAIGALLAVAQSPTPEGSVKPETSVAKEIDSYLSSLVAENKLSGAVLVAKDGVPVASKAAGIANKATGAPITLTR